MLARCCVPLLAVAVAVAVAVPVASAHPPPAAAEAHQMELTPRNVLSGVPASFDCSIRKLAYDFGKQLIPRMGKFESLLYALNLNDPTCTPDDATAPPPELPEPETAPPAAHALLVEPGESIQAAIDAAAATAATAPRGSAESKPVVLLRGGTHFLTATLSIRPEHSDLTLSSYPGERATLSGGKKLSISAWDAYNVSAGANIYVADIKGQVTDVPGLQLDGVRSTRARFPNLPFGIEASCGYGCMIPSANAVWTPPNLTKYGNVTFYTDMDPKHDRNDTADNWYKHYMIGIGGLCSVYDPPVSYCGGGAFAFRTPAGVTPKAGALPNLPKDGYAHPEDALFFVWRPERWANWMFEVGKVTDTNNFTFGYGGFQGARGSNSGGDFFIENVMEELDFDNEFYHDPREGKLYLFYNATGAPPTSLEVVTPQLQVLINHTGTQWNPVKGVTISNMDVKATAYTYMMPHGVPSAGDWALDRYGAIFLQGTEGVTIDGCTLERLDGNGVMVSGYNRNATISNSDFSFIGGNAIAAWGYTNETSGDNHPQAGIDGTDGNHPRYTTVIHNTVREVGLYEKQSSFFVQAKTAQSIITGNVFFNGPRAGINSNDGFGGGDLISHNLVFSTCRESGDHGPFNSWDRQPFWTTVRNGTPSITPAWREITRNFFMDNYSPQENVDNDDGSAYYHTHHNFMYLGGNGLKSDFGGHSNIHYGNVYAYIGEAIGIFAAPMAPGKEDEFYSNKVVLTGTAVINQKGKCAGPGFTKVHDNEYFTATGNITECGMTLAAYQKEGFDQGSTVAKTPADDTIIGWGKALLGMP